MSLPSEQSFFEQLGGEAKLRVIINDFIDRVFADDMVGFFFAKADKQRIKDKEYEFAAGHLGAQVPYTGRPLPAAHAPHHITGGHFMRRLQILRETLLEHGAPEEVIEHWIAHNESMRAGITQYQGSDCQSEASAAAANTAAETATAPSPQPKREASIAEINAYLEESSKRTRRRLTLAGGGGPAPAPSKELPLTPAPGAPSATRSLPLTGAKKTAGVPPEGQEPGKKS